MFVQLVKGRTSDPEGFVRQGRRWTDELKPDAKGFLGGTSGVSDDGRFVVVARFADESSARANSERREQGAWWEEMTKYVDGEATFRESSDTDTLFDGGSDQAGFVQVMEGKVADRSKLEGMETPEMLEQLRTARPDLMGALRVWFDDGEYAEIAYFTSEEEARKGESSGELEGPSEEYGALFGDITYTDLRHPEFN
jgi:hypothetical protein